MVVVRSKLNFHWMGHRYAPGDKMPATPEQARRLTTSGQAYYDFEDDTPTMKNTHQQIYEWGKERHFAVEKGMTKQQLLDLYDSVRD